MCRDFAEYGYIQYIRMSRLLLVSSVVFNDISCNHPNLIFVQALANVIRRQRVTIECWDYDYSPLKSYENDDFLGRYT